MKTKDDTETETGVELKQNDGGEPSRMPIQPLWGMNFGENKANSQVKHKGEYDAKQWSVTIRRQDGSIVPLSGLKSNIHSLVKNQ